MEIYRIYEFKNLSEAIRREVDDVMNNFKRSLGKVFDEIKIEKEVDFNNLEMLMKDY